MLIISKDRFEDVCNDAIAKLKFDHSSLILLCMFAAILTVELFDKEPVEE